MPSRVHLRTCPLCEAMCGLNELAPGRLVDPLSNNAVVNGIPVTVTAG